MSEPLQPYEPLRTLGPGLHCVDGDWYDTPFRRRMTVVSTPGGELAIHSAIRMSDADMASLDKLGRVAWILVTNAFHGSDAGFYAERYPSAKVLVPTALRTKLSRKFRVDGDFASATLPLELRVLEIEGLRMVHEAVFLHAPSRTLVLTDLAFNHQESDFKGGMRRFARWNGITQGLASSRVFRLVFVKDRGRVVASVLKMLEWDFDRVIVSHGRVVESGGKEAARLAFRSLEK